jgi:hypothetical protein
VNLHPTETVAYWRARARDARSFAKHARATRGISVESIKLYEETAKEAEQRAAEIEAKQSAGGAALRRSCE